jgi:hypothetical protein
MYRNLKYLGLILVMLLGLYPIIELTRIIIVSGEFYFPEMKGQFAAEITIMWALYLAIVPVFLAINTHKIRHYSKMKRELLKRTEEKGITSLPTEGKESYIRVNYNR